MAVAQVPRSWFGGLPKELQAAQEAILRPDVQEMLRKLSEHNLGIYMPHMHDEGTGEFQPLPDGVSQLEDGLKVSFHPEEAIVDREDRSYVPIGWVWRDGATPRMACTSRCVSQGTMHTSGS